MFVCVSRVCVHSFCYLLNKSVYSRSQYGVIDGWHRGDTVQLFDGSPPLVVQGLEQCEVVPLATAAARHRDSTTEATKCFCKGNCINNKSRCKKTDNPCTTTCHSGQTCSNRYYVFDDETFFFLSRHEISSFIGF